MRHITKAVYSFSELHKDVQEKIIEKYYEMETEPQLSMTTTHSTTEGGISPLSVADEKKKKFLYYYHKNKDRYREKKNAYMRAYRKTNKKRLAEYDKQYNATRRKHRKETTSI